MTKEQPGTDAPQQRVAERNPHRVEHRVRNARDSLPGQRAALPEGALGGVPADPQGDENRDPPANAPTPPD